MEKEDTVMKLKKIIFYYFSNDNGVGNALPLRLRFVWW